MMDEIVMGNGVGLALDEVVGAGGLWIEQRDDELIGLMVMHERVVAAIFVIAAHRRQGIARSMIGFLATTPSAPLDGWALPGDRATKSFYESLGWKARLLTMRAD